MLIVVVISFVHNDEDCVFVVVRRRAKCSHISPPYPAAAVSKSKTFSSSLEVTSAIRELSFLVIGAKTPKEDNTSSVNHSSLTHSGRRFAFIPIMEIDSL